MIDTHTHLYSEEFNEDLKEVILRAKSSGVEKFFLPAIDSSTHDKMLYLESEYPNEIFAMMGLHPCSVKPENWKDELSMVRKFLEKRNFCAIGEIGIDLYWDTSTLEIQEKVFNIQIDWAIELDLSIIIHSRESFDEIFKILETRKNQKLRGIFHCFSGNIDQAFRAIDLGFYLGIGGISTFKNGKIDQFLKNIPLEKIVLETDSPYLAPTPHRGKRNEPAFLSLVLDKLVDIYDIPPKEIERITNINSLNVFGITDL